MSRYIDGTWLLNFFVDLPDDYTLTIGNLRAVVNDAPSIDVVRCAECRHNPWDFDRTDYTCVWDDDFADRPQMPDDFCSYGEREGE